MDNENLENKDTPTASGLPDWVKNAASAPEPVKVEEPKPEPVKVEEPKPVAPEVKPAPVAAKPVEKHVVGKGDKDDVYLAKCVYKNIYERKSLTIHHLQRRLEQLGYKDAAGDKDGWLGELTMISVEKFQKDKGLAATGKVDAETFKKIFEGDSNVNVVI
jgi:hypothetical protein